MLGRTGYLLEENGSISTIFAHHTEEDMTLALSQPWCSIGSDGFALATEGPLRRGWPHPRFTSGTFPRVLGVYVREKKLLTLEDAIRKMTTLNAAKIGARATEACSGRAPPTRTSRSSTRPAWLIRRHISIRSNIPRGSMS